MKIEGEYLFNGPRKEVWEIVRDPEILATCIPGTQSLKQVSEKEYVGTINLKIGPVNGSFDGKLVMSNEVAPESCTLTVEGKGAAGFGKGVGHVHLVEKEDDKTLLQYTGDMQVGGTLASVGQRLIDSVSKSMIRQGLETLDKALAARIKAKVEGGKVEFKAPTQTEFAAGVAKDMTKKVTDIAEVRMLLYVIPVAALLLGFAYLLSKCN